jgi:hypothetical protein
MEAMDMCATIEELFETMFYMPSMPRLYNENQQGKRRLRKLQHATRDPERKTAVKWVTKTIR